MPYSRPDSPARVVATDWSQLVSGTIMQNIDVDENGNDLPAADIAWTGTLGGGTADGLTCADWTSSAANVSAQSGYTSWTTMDAGPGSWTAGSDTPCDRRAHLYCVEY
jgi:hypothetical protein